ncbi:MAG: HAD hydrolase-like protein [Holosporales bacterium]|jgi:HAD superfamily hydrolase (TIGR01450 family)|nr:HAD hydrolase-like protein [Holosporales bacterium]
MIYKNLEAIYEDYDSFLIDVYGVLYDGKKLYTGVLDILKKIKDSGRRIIILSNTTIVSKVCTSKYAELGLNGGIHYDQFMTSGEVFRQMIPEIFNPSAKYCQIFSKNFRIFEGSTLQEIDKISEADFVYVGVILGMGTEGKKPRRYTIDNLRTKSGVEIKIHEAIRININEIADFDSIAEILNVCLKYRKRLVISNPDIFAIEAVDGVNRPVLCQGGVGEFYEQMGGEVLYFGKPYLPIYNFVKRFLEGCTRTAMVGDTPWTDVLGGNAAGHATILTLTGVAGKLISEMDREISDCDKITKLIDELAPLMTHKQLKGYSQRPTRIIKSLA